jgi:hypothetical protein
MEIKVLKTTIASKNQTGTQCFEYLQGEIYDIYDELAEVFLKEGWGELVIEEGENKAIDNLENKQFKTKKSK